MAVMTAIAATIADGFVMLMQSSVGRTETGIHPLDRTILPIAEPNHPHSTVLDARDATAPPRFEIKAPAGAPKVLIVLVDDMGIGMPSAFGGPVRTPSADHLASQGLRYNQFHTPAVCSPTRTAQLSGRNHHMNNMGGITETATAFPGDTGQRSNELAPLAEMPRINRYSTGFFGGETDMWKPTIYDALARVSTPHHAPKEWIAKHKGKFDGGRDKLREETLARQIALGTLPTGTKLANKTRKPLQKRRRSSKGNPTSRTSHLHLQRTYQ